MMTLPDKPHELLRLGIDTLKKYQDDPNYNIKMTNWHNPVGSKCNICMAGAIMAEFLGATPDQYIGPGIYDEDTRSKLYALHQFSQGFLFSGGRCLGTTINHDDVDVRPFSKGGQNFYDDLEKIYNKLNSGCNDN